MSTFLPLAHGLVGKADLPLPTVAFTWGATIVLVASFVLLALGWQQPRLEDPRTRGVARVPRAVEVALGALGVLLFAGLVFAGLAGSQTPTANIVPTAVYVVFWVGLVVLCALLGDVWTPLNPWRAVGRAVGWVAAKVGGGRDALPEVLPYPERLGHWPAAATILAFGALELVVSDGSRNDPSTLALLAVAYAVVQWVGMALFGVEPWTRRGDGFTAYFRLFAAISPLDWHVEDRRLHLRRRTPLSGLTQVDWDAGLVLVVLATIGITSFDGFAEGPTWNSIAPELQQAGVSLGLSLGTALSIAFAIGLAAVVGIVAAFYRLGMEGMRSTVPRPAKELSRLFIHSLVPIALAYVVAHYFSYLVYQGQALGYLASDPLGEGANVFGTRNATIDYGVVSVNAVWYVQVASLLIGHVAGLVLAHDRALVAFKDARTAVRSQYWMLGVAVGFTTLGLWLLSEANG